MTELKEIFTENLNKIIMVFLFTIMMGQLGSITSMQAGNSDPRNVIVTRNDDASTTIGVAVKSNWWNDNTYFVYGPLYFRLAHTLEAFTPLRLALYGESEKEKNEKSQHYVLMLTSLLSVYALAL